MKKIAISFIAILVIALAVLALTQDRLPKKEREFVEAVQIEVDNLNTSVELALPPSGNHYKLGYPILLNLINRTFNTLTFPANFGVSLYIYDEANKYWLEIDNLTVYSHVGERQLMPVGKESTGEVTFTVYPDSQGLTQAVEVRVLVRGEQPQEGADSLPVGAYIDINLIP